MRRYSHRRNDPNYAAGPRARQRGDVDAYDIIRELYPRHLLGGGPVYARPWWAKLAYARGWMSAEAYYAFDEEPTGEVLPSLESLAYAESPFLAMLKRDTTFTPPETTT